ncbi:MAG TPA: 3-dehydroquinate synthase [Longimicrobiales bacterium]
MRPVVVCDDAIGAVLAELTTEFADHAICIVSDEVVAELHGRALAEAVAGALPRSALLTFPAGEASKTRETWARLTDAMIDARFGRDTVVVAIGGGVTGDLAGFVAATYMRGVPIVHVPTSLVAMVDAALGGKTAVDVPAGKNLVGAFHMPSTVVIDPRFLRTLPAAYVREGLVEALKHGVIADSAYFYWILAHAHALAREGGPADPADAARLVERSVQIKTEVVEKDPSEHGRRAILNFGHTVGHALEQANGYTISHGHAVARGMVVEARVGEALGTTAPGTADRIAEAVRALDIPGVPATDARAVLDAAMTDKKNRAGALRMTLVQSIGTVARAPSGAWTHEVSVEALLAALG